MEGLNRYAAQLHTHCLMTNHVSSLIPTYPPPSRNSFGSFL